MSCNHKHQGCCEHKNVRYCKQCKKVYCEDCGREWSDYTYWYPAETYPTITWSYTPSVTTWGSETSGTHYLSDATT